MKKILVVDNHPVMLNYMRGLLESAGHQVWTAEDGLTALDTLKFVIPDVMFIDLIMPNISGEKLCRIVRRMPQLKNAYVVILSGIAAEEKVRVEEFGADACIAKGPFKTLSQFVFKAVEDADSGREACGGTGTFGLDIVHPREITQELLSVKKHFEVILDSMIEGILEIVSDERIVYANPAAAALIGVPEENLLGAPLTDLFGEADRDRIRSLLGMDQSAPQCAFENSPLNLNGRQVLLKLRPVKDKYSKTIVMIHDVTERLRIESQLQQAKKFEAIGALAGGIAHDFNNILTAILGNISLAAVYLTDETKATEKLGAAEQAALRAKDLTQQLLPFSKGGAPNKKTACIGNVFRDVCRSVATNPGISCRYSVPDDLWFAEVDVLQIRQALQHLMNHAVQTMRNGGTVLSTASNLVVDSRNGLPLKQGKFIKIVIQDQGEGIPDDLVCNIFDPYFSIKDAPGGLGLATAYSIVHNHGGVIGVSSELRVGTTFEVYLPALERPALKQLSAFLDPARKQHRILVMDDEEVIRNVVGDMLSHLGYTVAFAGDGAEAIDVYKKALSLGKAFDGIIMDLTIEGGMGGKETIQRLRAIDPNVKAVVSSGYSHDPIMSRFREYGFCGALDKPYKLADLNNVLCEVLSTG